jgi:hypothetical protein
MSDAVLTTTPNPNELRAELASMVIGDLLGPAGGPDEELDERSVRDRYLVGVLSPSERYEGPPAVPDEDEEPDEADIPLIPDELSGGGADSLDDGMTDKDAPVSKARAFLPSSFGMTFCVNGDTDQLDIDVSWGQYLRETNEDKINEKTGRPQLVWKRYPRLASRPLPLRPGSIEPIAIDVGDTEGILIKGRIRLRDGHFIVTLFLVNGQQEPAQRKDEAYLFQPEMVVRSADGAAVFEKKLELPASGQPDPLTALEESTLSMLYRHHVEFGVGHGVSVHSEVSEEASDKATMICTRVVPQHEIPQTTPPTTADVERNPAFGRLEGLVLDMKELAECPRQELINKLRPLVTAYDAWIEREAGRIDDPDERLDQYRVAANIAIERCRSTRDRIEQGLQLLDEDDQVAEAFQFMNRAMWLQRTHSIFSEQVRRDGEPDFDEEIDIEENRRWYPFQLTFVILNLAPMAQLDHPDRSPSQNAIADLIFFPTGGGKTEAYLGLAAYTMAIRRLQGTVAGRSGEDGVTVLMRYTLRLLTIQQFQRATALMCACESIRRGALDQDDDRWGHSPFRIGLWVGRRTTPNRTEDAAEAIRQARDNQYNPVGTGTGTPHQLTCCPWCGSNIEIGKHVEVSTYRQGNCRTITYCGDKLGQCLFSRKQNKGEGLPIVVVDDEIYRRLPTLLIATVDKFAQMPWKGEVQMLFGQVNGYCDRHGYRSPGIEDSDSHPKTKSGLPSAKTSQRTPLRPPDLIIQDELHLISGPLGTMVGLYETAVDKLCTWEVDGQLVRPKVVASTATIRNADVQVHKIFLRKVNIFPPNGLDISDNFFSVQRTPDEEHPGRTYLGICAPGRRLKASLIKVYVAYLCSAQALYEKYGTVADPWMTLVGYFNSMRELGGMRRLVDDDVYSRARKMDRRGLAKRFFGTNYLEELTSRMRSEEIPKTLDRLERTFDPVLEAKRKEAAKTGDWRNIPQSPISVLLATNMISVGVDVSRLGLMVVAGQPKATAEYIQATSRVGRRRTGPGLVCTVFNWARPRDLSHYETFEHYHGTFYKHVEPLSVTPFAPGALTRGLAGLLVSLVRLSGTDFNSTEDAARVRTSDQHVMDAIDAIAERAGLVGDGVEVADHCRALLKRKADIWQADAENAAGGRRVTYTTPRGRGADRGTASPLLQHAGQGRWEEFTCLDSLRDVEPPVKLIVDDGGLDDVPQAGSGDEGETGTAQGGEGQ